MTMHFVKIVDMFIMLATLVALLAAALISKRIGIQKGIPRHYFIFELSLLMIMATFAASFLITQFTLFRYHILLKAIYIPAAVSTASFLFAVLMPSIRNAWSKGGVVTQYPLTARFFNSSCCFAISWVILCLFFLAT